MPGGRSLEENQRSIEDVGVDVDIRAHEFIGVVLAELSRASNRGRQRYALPKQTPIHRKRLAVFGAHLDHFAPSQSHRARFAFIIRDSQRIFVARAHVERRLSVYARAKAVIAQRRRFLFARL